MTDQVLPFAIPPVIKTVTVKCSPERAFHLFTADLAAWWPLQGFHVGPNPETCVFEQRLGGRVFERAADGTETLWGRVAHLDPPHRLAVSWLVKVTEPEAQLIELLFTPEGAGTRVQLTHSGWEKIGQRGAELRPLYDNGWIKVFEQGFGGYANSV